jgi:hypothetical protein
MEAALLLLLVLGFLNESETPVWTEQPTECKEITFDDPYVGPNTISRIEKTVRNSSTQYQGVWLRGLWIKHNR